MKKQCPLDTTGQLAHMRLEQLWHDTQDYVMGREIWDDTEIKGKLEYEYQMWRGSGGQSQGHNVGMDN